MMIDFSHEELSNAFNELYDDMTSHFVQITLSSKRNCYLTNEVESFKSKERQTKLEFENLGSEENEKLARQVNGFECYYFKIY